SHVLQLSGSNLDDISMQTQFGSLYGYTEKELMAYLKEHIEEISKKTNQTAAQVLQTMRFWYNGYCFAPNSELVYNPLSVLNFLKQAKTGNYWFRSGSPSFMLEALGKQEDILETIKQEASQGITMSENQLNAKFEVSQILE